MPTMATIQKRNLQSEEKDEKNKRYKNSLAFEQALFNSAWLILCNQGRHQGLTARTESGGPGLMGARRGARDLGKKAMGGKEQR